MFHRWGFRFGKLVPKVQVVAGDEKGKRGEVMQVLRNQNKLVIKNLNIAKRRIGSGLEGQSGTYLMEKGINVSNVALIHPVKDIPCKSSWHFLPDGTKQRVVRSERDAANGTHIVIPMPVHKKPKKSEVIEAGPYDTEPREVVRKTFIVGPEGPIPADCTL